MRIVHVVRQFHPSVGGLEGVVDSLAAEQAASGHQVRVVTLDRLFNAPDTPRLPSRERRNGIDVVRVPFFGSTRYPVALTTLRHIRDADIVHVHGIDFFCDYLAWTAPFHRRMLVLSTHGGFFHTGFAARLKRIYFNTVTRLSLRWYAGIAAVSVSDEQIFKPIRSHGLCVIENGVDIGKYADASSLTPKKTMIAVGRLSSNKRLDRAIRFLASVERIDPGWSLTIAGRVWDVSPDDLQRLADDLGVGGKVQLITDPPDTMVRAAMAQASVFLSASDYEGFGLVAIEGLSAGLWPVLNAIPPYRHLAERTGLGTVADFAESDSAARHFLANWTTISSDYARYRSMAMDAAATFDWRTATARYEQFYRSVRGQHVRTILDVPILVKTADEAVALLDRACERRVAAPVVFANAHTLNSATFDPGTEAVFDRAIIFNDGIGVDLASRLLFGKGFPENLNGTDFIPHYLRSSRHRHRVFLLGGKPGVAARAAQRLARIAPRHDFVGTCHGYHASHELPRIVAQIRQSRADILLVALGNPHQEAWLNAHLEDTGCRLGFGVGGLFDFMAGVVPRAPHWVRDAHLEWAYRLLQEPARLWRRYLVQMPLFLLRVAQQWFAGARISGVISR
ncbi:MAG TPA: WecB/TagA/CpsF family glycosyltransferase [Pseudolabrys sp.]|nr:WecB/TagA/CpsF family glycosyltransferase [Pseudolabrys sp.]